MDGTLDERLLAFWTAFNKLESGEECLEIAGEKCIESASSIISDFESEMSELRDALKGLTIALGGENEHHSKQVKIAQIKARTVFNIYARNHV